MEMTVSSILPCELLSMSFVSTAEKQAFANAKKQELLAAKEKAKLAKSQEKQAKKEEKINEKIRNELIFKAFGLDKKSLKFYNDNKEKFEQDLSEIPNENASDRSELDDSINVANGAFGTERSARRTLRNSAITGVAGIVGVDAMVTALISSLAGPFAPVTSVLVKMIETSFALIYAKYFANKAAVGNRSDTREKEAKALEEIKEYLSKVQSFVDEINRDLKIEPNTGGESAQTVSQKQILNIKNAKSKDEYYACILEYLKGKLGFFEGLNLQDCVKRIEDLCAEEVKKAKAKTKKKNANEVDAELSR